MGLMIAPFTLTMGKTRASLRGKSLSALARQVNVNHSRENIRRNERRRD
jgi:hypothetical protein